MKTVNELRDNLSAVFKDLREGKIKPSEAAQFSNLAGKMISSAKIQIEYATARQTKPSIPFLGS